MASSSTKINMADIYRFLATAMDFPQPSWQEDHFFSFIFNLLDELKWEADHDELIDFVKKPDWLDSLQIEHTRLFINAVPHVVAPPYGSVYLSSAGQLYGPTTERTRTFYRERGYDLASETDIPDHLIHELQFLALLNEENKVDDEELFLQKLFYPWFPIFRDKVLAEAQYPYYRIIVKLIDYFTKEES